jgi:Sphingosine kinase and enzymes related to eukaryotic diacylglycerol kinase
MAAKAKSAGKALIIINPVAGFSNAEQLQKVCEEQFELAGWSPRFHFTQVGENLAKLVQKESKRGLDLVVAVGGDGTVAAVAAALLNTKIPLGILPTGTWNAIARQFYLPASPQRAIALMTGPHSLCKLDMMAVGDTIHAMNLGVGFSASMIKGSDRQQKRHLGNLAYFKTFAKQLFGLQMQKYLIEVDGRLYKGRATEIMVANYGVIGLRFFEDRLNIHPDDGKVEILILKARTILDLPILIWQIFMKPEKRTPKYRKLSASREIRISTTPPVAVQADGEELGQTPVTVKILPRTVRVIAPLS